jgi:hypothetical protein
MLIVCLLGTQSAFAQSKQDSFLLPIAEKQLWASDSFRYTLDTHVGPVYESFTNTKTDDFSFFANRYESSTARSFAFTLSLNREQKPIRMDMFQKKFGLFVFGVYPLRESTFKLPTNDPGNIFLQQSPAFGTGTNGKFKHPKIQFGIGINISF